MNQKITISVIGGHDVDEEVGGFAEKVGKLVAEVGGILVCGGLRGVMEASCRGAKKAKGMTIGLLPGKDKNEANPYVDIALPTSIGYARNAMVACCADIILALPGSNGTCSEICYGLVYGRPVLDLGGWNMKGMIPVKDLKDARRKLKHLIKLIESNRKTLQE